MFDRVGNLAERVATNVSRRAFLGRLGQGALGLAAAIGGIFAFPNEVRADCLRCAVPTIYGYDCGPKPKNGACPYPYVVVPCSACPKP